MLHIARFSGAAFAVALSLATPVLAAADKASFNDTARYLAGLSPSAASPLVKLTRDPAWQQHARALDASWRELEQRRLSKIRAWRETYLKDRHGPMFYMFSGPDFLYADAFYPNSSVYVLSGLEPVGRIPEVNERTAQALGGLRASISSSVALSFFITKNMKHQLRGSALSGTLPIILIYAARAGKTVDDVTLVTLDSEGQITPVAAGTAPRGVQGVKIAFAAGEGRPAQTLYYFSTDISDSGVKHSGFLKFCETLGMGDALFKSASYLPHSGGFAQVRDFIIARSHNIVQDDSGIPVGYFKSDQWQFMPFGRYLGPIAIFPGRYQQRLADIYRKGAAKPLDFGMGYRWRPNESNLLLVVRKDLSAKQ